MFLQGIFHLEEKLCNFSHKLIILRPQIQCELHFKTANLVSEPEGRHCHQGNGGGGSGSPAKGHFRL